MSHAVNLQAMLEHLLVLEHFALGSSEFFKSNGVTSFEETGYLQPLSARTLLKGLVCEKLIDVAMKGRILSEHVAITDSAAFERIQAQALTALRISYDTKGSETLSLRESFNKIIHATQVSISISESETEPGNTHFWDGQVHLIGTLRKSEWSHSLVVGDWAKAVRRLLMQLIREEQLAMLEWAGGL